MSILTITKTLTAGGNLYGLSGSYTITINLTKIQENVDKSYKDFDNPVTTGSYASKVVKKTVIDMKWYKEAYEYMGHLMVCAVGCKTGDGGANYSSYEQKNILKAMAQQGGPCTVKLYTSGVDATSQTDEPTLYSGALLFITKIMFTDIRTEGDVKTGGDATQVIGHDVQIGFLVGTAMGS